LTTLFRQRRGEGEGGLRTYVVISKDMSKGASWKTPYSKRMKIKKYLYEFD